MSITSQSFDQMIYLIAPINSQIQIQSIDFCNDLFSIFYFKLIFVEQTNYYILINIKIK